MKLTTRNSTNPSPTTGANIVVASPVTSSVPSRPTPGTGNGNKKGK